MTNSFEKSLAAPKSKYVEHILVATNTGDAGVAEVFRTLQHRLRDSTWTIVFKALIIVHLMIREGEPNVTLKFLADAPSKLDTGTFSDGEEAMASIAEALGDLLCTVLTEHGLLVQVQGSNIRHYSVYLLARVKSYRDTKIDWVREGQGRLKRQTIDKGLLRETESVQKQIAALLKCDVIFSGLPHLVALLTSVHQLLSTEPENEISLTAFRLLTMDLLILYHVMNEGTINVLEHYFEMSRYDAERALSIYKTFSQQTNRVVEFLGVARQHENATRLAIPKLKHAPTSLTASLEEYLYDPDFEINRRQYLAQQEAKKSGKQPVGNGTKGSSNDSKKLSDNNSNAGVNAFTKDPVQAAPSRQEPKAPAPDLIDFFESIEQNPQSYATSPPQQTTGFQTGSQYQYQQPGFPSQQNFASGLTQVQQQVNGPYGNIDPFGQSSLQQQPQQGFSGAGFAEYPQQAQQPQQPFSPSQTGLSNVPQDSALSFAPHQKSLPTGRPQSTNPFRQSVLPQSTASTSPAQTASPPMTSPANRQSTNPFARSINTQLAGQSESTPFTSPYSTQASQSAPSSTGTSFFSSNALQSPSDSSQTQQAAQPLQSTRTGTNPFVRNVSQPTSQSQTPITSPLMPNPTGSTNPFRQSAFVNQQTGQGWQASQGTIGGGLDQLEIIPVFPRPGQPSQVQQPQPWL
ncbi:MAG: hypothetical protein Q9187_001119 [Circinaria calcarea]